VEAPQLECSLKEFELERNISKASTDISHNIRVELESDKPDTEDAHVDNLKLNREKIDSNSAKALSSQ